MQPAYPVAQPVVAVQPAYPVVAVRAPIVYTLQLGCSNLDRKDVFSKSDPFIVLSAARNPAYASNQYKTQSTGSTVGVTGDWVVVHKVPERRAHCACVSQSSSRPRPS